ncbi:MAG TPA: hypothetical protein VKG65_11300, partial [Terriglobales bacterium]|nr:hypothetical protein [Terriglobales bacterium]
NGGDDAAVGVRRRAHEAPLQAEAADEALALFVEYEFEPQSGCVARAATEAMVGDLLLLNFVTVNSFVPGHVVKMNES